MIGDDEHFSLSSGDDKLCGIDKLNGEGAFFKLFFVNGQFFIDDKF